MQFSWPPLTSGVRLLIWINLLVAIANLLTGGLVGDYCAVSYDRLGAAYGLGVLTLVTSIFVHDLLSPWHLIGNMVLGLWVFGGCFTEPRTGYVGILRLYLGAGIFGSIVFVLTGLVTGSPVPAVGASGAALGIAAFAAAADPQRTIRLFFVIPIQLGWLVGLYVFLDFWAYALLLGRGISGGVAVSAHLGGAAYGVFAFYMLRSFHDTPARYDPPGRDGFFGIWAGLGAWAAERRQRAAARQAQRDREQAAKHQQRLDELLDKVHREGMDKLTDAERKFLQKASESSRR